MQPPPKNPFLSSHSSRIASVNSVQSNKEVNEDDKREMSAPQEAGLSIAS